MGRRLAVVIPLALLVAGCGTTTIDRGKAEDFLRGTLGPPRPRAVSCPDGVKVRKGGTFTCQATLANGRRVEVTLHMVDDTGRVSVSPSDVRPAR